MFWGKLPARPVLSKVCTKLTIASFTSTRETSENQLTKKITD